MTNSPEILVVEDNQVTSKTLTVFLKAEQYGVKPAFNGRDGLRFFREGDFDLVLLDLMLPDIDGLAVCEAIREESLVPIVILTAKTQEDEIVKGLECGADDYVCKPFGSKELLARIRRCLRQVGRHADAQQIFRLGEIEIDTDQRTVTVAGNAVKLTKSEFEILAVMIRQPGRVFTRDQLIDHALGANFEGFDRTIDTHVWSLRKKIGEPRGNPKYILSELGIGYRMSDQHAK